MSKMPRTWPEAQQWADERIGKKIYRLQGSCHCETCMRIPESGLVILDKNHAQYLVDWSMETGTIYADTKEEL